MELTQEYVDKKFDEFAQVVAEGFRATATKKDLEGLTSTVDGLASRMEGFATKVDLEEAIKPLATKPDLEELARMTAEGFLATATKAEVDTLRKEIRDTRMEMHENFEGVRTTIGKVFDRIDGTASKQEIFDGELNRLRVLVESK